MLQAIRNNYPQRIRINSLAGGPPRATLGNVRARIDAGETDFAALLSAHGLRRTQPRVAVLNVLGLANTHLSVADIHHRLAQAAGAGLTPPDLATVYRTVSTLVENGVVHSLAIEGGVTTYGLAHDPHHHAVCTRCGAIIEVPALKLTAALEQAVEGSAFTLSEHAGLTLHGLCPLCQTAQ